VGIVSTFRGFGEFTQGIFVPYGHPIRLFEPIVYTGLAYLVVALYLRRVV